MKTLISKIRNSDMLSYADVLKLKVSLVLLFLFIFGVLTVPVTLFEEFSLEVLIFLPTAFTTLFLFSSVMLVVNKVRTAMHFSIYTFGVLTVYYALGSNPLYGVFLMYVTLTIIIFYQDIYTYIVYGAALTLYGLIYIHQNGAQLVAPDATSVLTSNLVYQGALMGFFLIFLIYFILSEIIYEQINHDYKQTQQSIKKITLHVMTYTNELRERENHTSLHNDENLQKAVRDVSVFFASFYPDEKVDMEEYVDFYFFLHHQDLQAIYREHRQTEVEKYARELEKYLINKPNDLMQIHMSMTAKFYQGAEGAYPNTRYEFKIDENYRRKVNRIIMLACLYRYLRVENTQYDRWKRLEASLSHDDIINLINSQVFRSILSHEEVKFFLENHQLFNEYLG